MSLSVKTSKQRVLLDFSLKIDIQGDGRIITGLSDVCSCPDSNI